MKQLISLDIEDATIMINAAVKKSKEINVLETICVVDNAGFPIKMERMDGARVTGPQISWNKAFTAATHKRSTHLFNKPPNGPALPGNEAFGIQLSFEGKFAVFVGGFPICVDDNVVGGNWHEWWKWSRRHKGWFGCFTSSSRSLQRYFL